MENDISNGEQIRKLFEKIFSDYKNKYAFFDYLYGKQKNCPTLHAFYGVDALCDFYFHENTSKEDKEVIERYAKVIMRDYDKDRYSDISFSTIVSLLSGDTLEKALIENYNIIPKYFSYNYYPKYSKYFLKNNEGFKYIEIQVNNFGSFLSLENRIAKEFNQ